MYFLRTAYTTFPLCDFVCAVHHRRVRARTILCKYCREKVKKKKIARSLSCSDGDNLSTTCRYVTVSYVTIKHCARGRVEFCTKLAKSERDGRRPERSTRTSRYYGLRTENRTNRWKKIDLFRSSGCTKSVYGDLVESRNRLKRSKSTHFFTPSKNKCAPVHFHANTCKYYFFLIFCYLVFDLS